MQRPKGKRLAHRQKQFRRQALHIYPFCQWCACPLTAATATTDHLTPLSRGGGNDWGNLCLACRECNQARKNDLPSREPLGPRWGERRPARLPFPEGKPLWVAWTRYPGGRWRRTFRGRSPEGLLQSVGKVIGRCAEAVILADGQEPAW